ncbi:hypothetical protein B0H13DRAFT_2319833 [Mycena leptocephala]|nr:hypothetical protein B0H13DRAFT_2319833 [Mycena leptocephala]
MRAELRSYVRSEKWAMDPEKLVEFSQQKMVPAAADKYLRKITEEEMPAGLKKYMEVELFPRMSFKVGPGFLFARHDSARPHTSLIVVFLKLWDRGSTSGNSVASFCAYLQL